MFFTAIRILILLLSFLGYCIALRKKDIPMPFVPILVMTGAGSLLFLAGILNMLPHTVALLLLGGLLCAFREKIWHSFGSLSGHDRICFAIYGNSIIRDISSLLLPILTKCEFCNDFGVSTITVKLRIINTAYHQIIK